MKVKSLLVFASAAAMPFAAAFAQNNSTPSGPQGTGWYGNLSPFAAYDRNGDGVITADEYAAAYGTPSGGATISPQYDRNANRAIRRDERRTRNPYDGFSADTNPPTPAP